MIATKVSIRHEVERVTVTPRPGGDEVEDELGLLLQRQPLDGEQGVGLGVADNNPPTFFTFGWEKWCNDGSRHFIFAFQFDLDIDWIAALQVVLVENAVLQFDVRVPVNKTMKLYYRVCHGFRLTNIIFESILTTFKSSNILLLNRASFLETTGAVGTVNWLEPKIEQP